ncbi:MAG: glycosyltransferase [Syntrophaceae bacterium]|nr:glycosyltransferase [Syntrophaceae bacterium]
MIIVHIIPSFNVGGGELLAVRICAEIKRRHPSFSVHLISLYDPFPSVVYTEAVESGAAIHTLGKQKGPDPRLLFRMRDVLLKIDPNVIHTHLAGLRYSMGAALLIKKAVKIHTIHNIAEREASRTVLRLHRFAFNRLGWLPVALSPEIQNSIRDFYGIDAPVVNNGIRVDPTIRKEQKNDLRKKSALPLDANIIITIGRLCPQKNQILLIDAFEKLTAQSETETILLVVGEDSTSGSYRLMLENRLRALPEQQRKRVHLLGVRKDIPELLIAADVFVLSSDWEGLPLTLLEAMGYGTPVVCTAVGGIPDAIEQGVSGLLVPAADAKRLADAIFRLLNDKSLGAQMAKAAREKFQMHYSIERTAESYVDLYNRYLNYAESF